MSARLFATGRRILTPGDRSAERFQVYFVLATSADFPTDSGALQGDIGYAMDADTLYTYDGTGWVTLTGAAGPQGPAGAAGSQGPAGNDGATGAQGQAGAAGAQGQQGNAGTQGIQGDAGAAGGQGAQGIQGVPGNAGGQGIQGIQGIQGPAGPNLTTSAFGYTTGAGGAVVQATSKATAVTLNKLSGKITMHAAALAAAAEVAFTLTNSTIAVTDVVIVNIQSVGTAGAYSVCVGAVSAGSCSITLGNHSAGSLSQAVVLSFAVIKAAVA